MPINPNKIMNKIFSKEFSLMLYKIFNDTLFLLTAAFVLLLTAEALLPGFSSSYLSFTKMVLLMFANLGAVIYLGKRNNIQLGEFDFKKNKLWLALFLIFFIFLLIRALYKFSWGEIIIIIIISLFILYYLYKTKD
jgi:hypothetical protein